MDRAAMQCVCVRETEREGERGRNDDEMRLFT